MHGQHSVKSIVHFRVRSHKAVPGKGTSAYRQLHSQNGQDVEHAVCNTGDGLYLGNSMPIRDMDMYADAVSSPERGFGEATPEPLPPLPAHGFGVIPGAGMSY